MYRTARSPWRGWSCGRNRWNFIKGQVPGQGENDGEREQITQEPPAAAPGLLLAAGMLTLGFSGCKPGEDASSTPSSDNESTASTDPSSADSSSDTSTSSEGAGNEIMGEGYDVTKDTFYDKESLMSPAERMERFQRILVEWPGRHHLRQRNQGARWTGSSSASIP